MPIPTLDRLRKALQISEQIESLKANLASFFAGVADVSTKMYAASVTTPKKRTMSAAGRARVAAAQRSRWAKQKGSEPAPAAKSKKTGLSAAGRARIIAAQKARWAKVKGRKSTPAPAKAGRKKKRHLSPEARARIVAAVKARWAREKKGE